MDTIKDIILVSVPALLVLLAAYFSVRQAFRNEQEKRRNELALAASKTVIPVRLQAYERLTLLLERISVESLIMRTSKDGIDTRTLQSSMLRTIRAEFDHNLSQQIYVSPQAWEIIKNARTNTIKLINSSAEKLPPGASASDFSRYLLEKVMEMEKEPTRVALEFLKAEVSRML